MNTITILEFSLFALQRLMNGGGTRHAGGQAMIQTPAIPCGFGSRKLLPAFNAVFKKRFGNARIL
jgi:hypothetical protein